MKWHVAVALVLLAAAAVARAETDSAEVKAGGSNDRTFTTPTDASDDPKKPKITVISNNNVLHQVIPKAAGLDKNLAQEQRAKDKKENFAKQDGEGRAKSAKERLRKQDARAALKRQQMREQMVKQQQMEQREKTVRERDTKARLRAKRKREREHKDRSKREQLHKRAARRRERKRKHAHRVAQEKRSKRRHRRHERSRKRRSELSSKRYEGEKKRLQERKRKRTMVRINARGGWRDYGSGYASPAVRRLGSVCIVEGLVAGNGGLIATLPDSCRPSGGRLIFSLIKGGSPARVDVLPDGRIFHITGGGGSWLSLAGIRFSVKVKRGRLSLGNGWVNYGHGYRGTQLHKTKNLCVLSGLIRSGRWGQLARVSRSCRPDARLIFSANNHEGTARLDVVADSNIYWVGGSRNHGWVNFDGMVWSPRTGSRLRLKSGWRNYHSSYRVASYSKHGSVCVVSGLIKSGRWHGYIATLPRGCRPKGRLIFGGNVHVSSARIDVLPNGQIHYVNGKQSWNWLALDGIVFATK